MKSGLSIEGQLFSLLMADCHGDMALCIAAQFIDKTPYFKLYHFLYIV